MTDQPNVSTRSHKKNGNNGKEKEQSTETPATVGDKAVPQSAFLPGFSTEQAQSLNIYMSEIIQTANVSFKVEILENMATLQAAIANLGNSLKPTGSNSLNSAPAQEPTFGGAPYQSGFPARNFPARWRPEELGTFDPDTDDVFTFLGRIREVADLRDSHTVQLNLSLQLRGKAKRWFELELSHDDKAILYNPANGTSAWTDALIGRFQPSGTLTLQKLHETTYTRADAAAKKDPTDFVHDVIALTRTRPLEESLMEAYLRFESGLQVNLVPPDKFTTVREFMEQVNAKKHAWYQNYAHFKKKLYDDQIPGPTNTPSRGYVSRQPRNNSAPSYTIRSGLGPTTTSAPENSRPDAPKYGTTAPRVPQLQGVYHGTTEEHSQSRPQYTPSQSHTPRAFGNTHDDDNEAEEAYFVEHEHGCNVIGCPHRHDN